MRQTWAGAGALLPITSFGHSLVHSAYENALKEGIIGIFTGIYNKTQLGISYTIILAVFIGLLFKPKK